MAALNPPTAESARKILSEILQALSSVGQKNVAEAIATSESTISRLKDQLPTIVAMLGALGYQVLPLSMKAYDEKTIGAVLELARQRMAELDSPDALKPPEAPG